ncbi:hypothetical protein JCM6882_008320 [Rhodosporidiobolus microsporus]
MSRPWDLYLTPTITLSLVLEAESPTPSLTRWLAQWAVWLRPLLLKSALQYELDVRGGALAHNSATGEGDGVVSASTLRVVDSSVFRVIEGKASKPYSAAELDSLAMSVANAEGIDVPSLEHDLLVLSLERVLYSYLMVHKAEQLAGTPYPPSGDPRSGEAESLLRELWHTLRPERELPAMVGKHWQELGFQNTSPSTDFRGVGLLGLHCLLLFARTYGERAAEIVDESVGAGERWYPLALASLHMTAFVLDLARSRDLQLFLLRSLQTPSLASSSPPSARSPDLASDAIPLSSTAPLLDLSYSDAAPADRQPSNSHAGSPTIDLEPLLSLSSDLLLLFHAHWRQGTFTVMDFETTSRAFQAALRPWIRRGVLDGRALGWEKWDEGGVKLD